MDRIELRTKRLLLREIEAQDFEAVHAYGSDPEVCRYTTFGPNTEEETRNFTKRCRTEREEDPRRVYSLAIVLRERGELIGGCGFRITAPEHRKAAIGYVVGRPWWGRGCATEAARALLRLGFETLMLHRISAICDVRNPASARVMEKIGMQREGIIRDNMWRQGEWITDLQYAILEDKWRAISRAQ